ncbi:sensor histidine kinase [Bacillus taeanensis]|uniref:histidine kinase n=1 Tax=Bacillus taeanensis TaxID=273032 RepID=A0A366XXR2_9BACI|nr:HAMP domain-containing sensor histidine kinase [Bacillus taeanensis]RBW69569.1 hypothetical protein DS031_10080 [Bacillus taeanensis]
MGHSIERKILIPFLMIVLLPILIIGVVSMWSSYQSDKHLKQAAINKNLASIEHYALRLDKEVNEGGITESQAKSFLKMMMNEIDGLYVEDENGEMTYQGMKINQEHLDWLNRNEQNTSFFKESIVLTKELSSWNWQLYVPIQFSVFSGSLPDIQKYTLLISIITSIIAVQLTILFSYHLSKPIKNLAAFCRQISKGEKVKDPDIKKDRKDEIGILASSLTEMVERLDKRNHEIEKMKLLNETILNSVHVGMVLVIEGAESIYNEAAKKMMKENAFLKEKVETLTSYESKKRHEEIWHFQTDEEMVYYAVNYRSLEDIEGMHRDLITFENITQRRKLEQRVERMSRLASLGEMASGIAHEIRNPLAGIKTTTELLMRRLALSKDHLMLAENMLAEIDRVNKIITNLLQFSRPLGSNPQRVDLDEVVTSVFLLMKRIAKEKNITLYHEENHYEIMVDRDQLRQILLNVMINGMNAMPNGGELSISSKQKGNEVVMLLSDTGIGMEESVIKKIFDPFFTTRSEGTGLGLSVVHQLVVQNKGEIDVSSQKGKGTTFSIAFPIGEGSERNGS